MPSGPYYYSLGGGQVWVQLDGGDWVQADAVVSDGAWAYELWTSVSPGPHTVAAQLRAPDNLVLKTVSAPSTTCSDHPTAPRTLVAAPTNVSGQVKLTWLAPASTGGSPVMDYVIQRSANGTSGWATITDGVNTATSYTVTGLTNGTRYYFRVIAKNSVGNSAASNVANNIPRTVPSAPRTLTATPTNVSGQIRISWLLPAANGGAAITDYIIQRSPNGTTGWATLNDGVSNTITFTETGLTNGTRYYFRVLAKNAAGNSPVSNTANAVPGKPTAPRTLTVAPTNVSGQVRLSWLLPATTGGLAITDYVIQRSPNGTTGWATIGDGVSTTTTFTVTGLTNGTRYYFRVLARNAAGNSAWSNVVNAIPRTVPSAPRTLTAAATNVSGQIRISWLLPAANGGAAITDYIIQRSPNGTTGWATINDGVSNTITFTETGLTNGTRYYFRVLAKNAAGNSPWSNTANTIPRTVPSAARTLAATPTNLSGQIRLTWLAPAANGGSAITDYIIQRSPNGTTGWSTINDGVRTTTTYTVTGLTNGTRYYFRVLVRNAAGTGAASNVANAVPRTKPSAPALRATAGNARVTLAWTPPTSNGGSAITRYIIQRSTSPTSGWINISTNTAATARSFTATGLRNGTRYYFRIAAVNSAGIGPWSAIGSAVPVAPRVPGAPIGLAATGSYDGYLLVWSAPNNGGSPITDYKIQLYESGGYEDYYYDEVSTLTSAWIALVGYGCDDIRVAAVNAVGVGPYSTVHACYLG